MRKCKSLYWIVCGLVACLPGLAQAHSEHDGLSFVGGLLHPLLGPDHLLAMLSVGIVSALIGGGAVYWVPSAFVAAMLGGAVMGIMGVALPHVELGIALSVLVLGAAIAMPARLPLLATGLVVALFGLLHGNAHGVEIPRAAVPAFYSFGFIVSTATIHVLGVGIGYLPPLHRRNRLPMDVAGMLISVVGVYFLINAGL
jgi:urease accessory protein